MKTFIEYRPEDGDIISVDVTYMTSNEETKVIADLRSKVGKRAKLWRHLHRMDKPCELVAVS